MHVLDAFVFRGGPTNMLRHILCSRSVLQIMEILISNNIEYFCSVVFCSIGPSSFLSFVLTSVHVKITSVQCLDSLSQIET